MKMNRKYLIFHMPCNRNCYYPRFAATPQLLKSNFVCPPVPSLSLKINL